MGICYQGKTLSEAVQEKERLFRETGHAYALQRLELVEDDPAKFMRFQMRLVAACINVREMAKLISANPMSMIQGELLFLFANAEGDATCASYGLAGHIQALPFIIRSIADLGFEEDPGINVGDIFSTNDPMYGAPHNADCYTWVPVFYKDELIGWTVGLNHITDVGGLQPGGLGVISASVFTDGFTYPPTKTGNNFKQHKWWDLHWKRRTRTEAFNILDDKMRAAGAVALHDRVLEIVEEFGVDYFRNGLREIIERERRLLIERIRTLAVPGKYHYLFMDVVRYKDVVGKLFASSNRDWVIHLPVEFNVLPEGNLFMDMDGLTSEDDFHCNSYEPSVRMNSSMGAWPMFAHTVTLNTALYYMTAWNFPPGSMFNPQNPFAGTVMGLAQSGKLNMMYHTCLSYAYFARGYLEECMSQDAAGIGYGLSGIMADGFRWAGGDMSLITCWSCSAFPYRDGDMAGYCTPNPAADQGETELGEFLQPTNLNIGKKLVSDYCGHGKFRGGNGIGFCQLIVDPGQSLTVATFAATGGMGRAAIGMCGGYPGVNDVVVFAHDTNMRKILNAGKRYPTDFTEIREWLKEGKLKAGSVEAFKSATPNIQCQDGDLYATASAAMGGWGDVLERDYALIEKDVKYSWITANTAKTVYGAITDENGKVKVAESDELRRQMRNVRKEKSLDAREWWKQEREKVLQQDFSNDVYNMYADIVRYDKFHTQFMGIWQLPEDYKFVGLRL
ncbi:MAG: hydantoinase B/oxoprolinase family protein [Chloroflexi bacterium]|nr:hydantoinase B/oxoprolinase family protein [Chloroflexota bacterium]